eukprot:CAMPEP_0198111948 /NCGR_PEP_ID=MMETSP1442-20131203/3864_1 /TAXON_ID= /ORGANISM="Craspedostauros australis, Strain CCMP3328" /LENGTH=73 /DNA_ID=CAMNT_0043768561 /DNA_START=49 /DNA_END=267 /DNA_ORIENTATION=+
MPRVTSKQLLDAVAAGDLSAMKKWNEKKFGVDINRIIDSYCRTPLHLACSGGHQECVEHLIESYQADVNCKDS